MTQTARPAPSTHPAVVSGVLNGEPVRIRTANGGDSIGWGWSHYSFHSKYPVLFVCRRTDGSPMPSEFARWHGWDGVGTALVELTVLDGPSID